MFNQCMLTAYTYKLNAGIELHNGKWCDNNVYKRPKRKKAKDCNQISKMNLNGHKNTT